MSNFKSPRGLKGSKGGAETFANVSSELYIICQFILFVRHFHLALALTGLFSLDLVWTSR